MAQNLGDLEHAYQKRSVKIVEKFIDKSTYPCKKENKIDTSDNLNALVDEFLDIYFGLEEISCPIPILAEKPGVERFIFLQPEIEVAFVDQLDSAAIFATGNAYYINRSKLDAPDDILFPHKNLYYGDFPSAGYYNFPNIQDSRKMGYCVRDKKQYDVLLADTNMIKTVKKFLDVKGLEYYRRWEFLKPVIGFFDGGFVRQVDEHPSVGEFQYKLFTYNFLIDRVVFDKDMKQALIQFSFPYDCYEAFFSNDKKKWNLKNLISTTHID